MQVHGLWRFPNLGLYTYSIDVPWTEAGVTEAGVAGSDMYNAYNFYEDAQCRISKLECEEKFRIFSKQNFYE